MQEVEEGRKRERDLERDRQRERKAEAILAVPGWHDVHASMRIIQNPE